MIHPSAILIVLSSLFMIARARLMAGLLRLLLLLLLAPMLRAPLVSFSLPPFPWLGARTGVLALYLFIYLFTTS
jgi:hypothetical protein